MPFVTQGPEGEQAPYRASKTNWKFLLIVVFIFIFITISVLFYINKINKEILSSNSLVLINNYKNIEINDLAEVEVKMSNDEAKKFFQATEIVNNNLPDSIEFWTEAYCPGSGTKYDYKFIDIKIYEYVFDSCTEEGFGVHGGCETCMMSKIKLKKAPNEIEDIKLQELFLDCGVKKLLREEKIHNTIFSYYEIFFEITDKVKIKMNGRAWDNDILKAIDSFMVLDDDKEISKYSVNFFSQIPVIDIFSYNNKKYFLIHGGEYGNKGGTSEYFLYVIKENGHVEPVKSSWGGNFYWTCDEFRESCTLDYVFGYKNNVYLVIGGNVWHVGENDIFKDRIYASAAIFDENELSFIVVQTKENPVYLGICSTNIQDSGISSDIKLPEDFEKLNYGELVADEELCKKRSGFWTIFSDYCLFQEACREKGVIPNSPADKAGILSGDVILELDGNKLTSDKLSKILAQHKPGEELELKILREGKINLIPIKLEEKPEDLDPTFDTPTNIIINKEIRETYKTCKFIGQACLAEGTKITMLDDSYKNIEDIKEGDVVKSLNLDASETKGSEVIRVIKREDPIVNINNVLKAAPDQLIYLIDGNIKTAIELKVGDLLFNEVRVDSVEYSPDRVETYDLILKDAVNFFANGYLVRTPN